jgi:hypothetical protein
VPPPLLARADEVIEQIIMEPMPGACAGAESAHGGTKRTLNWRPLTSVPGGIVLKKSFEATAKIFQDR